MVLSQASEDNHTAQTQIRTLGLIVHTMLMSLSLHVYARIEGQNMHFLCGGKSEDIFRNWGHK